MKKKYLPALVISSIVLCIIAVVAVILFSQNNSQKSSQPLDQLSLNPITEQNTNLIDENKTTDDALSNIQTANDVYTNAYTRQTTVEQYLSHALDVVTHEDERKANSIPDQAVQLYSDISKNAANLFNDENLNANEPEQIYWGLIGWDLYIANAEISMEFDASGNFASNASKPGWYDLRFNINNVHVLTELHPACTQAWFGCLDCYSPSIVRLSNIKTYEGLSNIHFDNFDSNGNASFMFMGQYQATTPDDFQTFISQNMSYVKNAYGMFSYTCFDNLNTAVEGLTNSGITNLAFAFNDNAGLTDVDLTNVAYDDCANIQAMFLRDPNITKVEGLSNSKPISAETANYMFWGCTKLSSFNEVPVISSSTKNVQGMFGYCAINSLDLSLWNYSGLVDVSYLYEYCQNLVYIYVAADTDWSNPDNCQITTSTNMFDGCQQLTGCKGTQYSVAGVKDLQYALIDGLNVSENGEKPGYYTYLTDSYVVSAKSNPENCGSFTYYAADGETVVTGLIVPDGTTASVQTGPNSTLIKFEEPVTNNILGYVKANDDASNEEFVYQWDVTGGTRTIDSAEDAEFIADFSLYYLAPNTSSALLSSNLGAIDFSGIEHVSFATGSASKPGSGYTCKNDNLSKDKEATIQSYVNGDDMIIYSDKMIKADWDSLASYFEGQTGIVDINLINLDVVDNRKTDVSKRRGARDISNMFKGCSNLFRIFVDESWTTEYVTNSSNMFVGCAKLTGGNGTLFDSRKFDGARACIDYHGNIGYMTYGAPDRVTINYQMVTEIFLQWGTISPYEQIVKPGMEYTVQGSTADMTAHRISDPVVRNIYKYALDGWKEIGNNTRHNSGYAATTNEDITLLTLYTEAKVLICSSITPNTVSNSSTRGIVNDSGAVFVFDSLEYVVGNTYERVYNSKDGDVSQVCQCTVAEILWIGDDGAFYPSKSGSTKNDRTYLGDDSKQIVDSKTRRTLIKQAFATDDFQRFTPKDMCCHLGGYTYKGWFEDCEELVYADLHNANATRVYDMGAIFWKCKKLTTAFIPHFDRDAETGTLIAKYKSCSNLFRDCTSLVEVDMSEWAGAHGTGHDLPVDIWGGQDTYKYYPYTEAQHMFEDCVALEKVTGFQKINFNGFYWLQHAFKNCSKLKQLGDRENIVDMTSFTTFDCEGDSSCKNASLENFFGSCTSITEIDFSNFTGSTNVDLVNLFKDKDKSNSECTGLKTIDLQNFKWAPNLNNWFKNCTSLENVNMPNFVGPYGKNSCQDMFNGCSAIKELSLPKLGSTGSITDMSKICRGMANLEVLDISGFDNSNVTNMSNAFDSGSGDQSYSCPLKTIYVGDNWVKPVNVSSTTYAFSHCGNLCGGNGTMCDITWQTFDATHCVADAKDGQAGFLTYKSSNDLFPTDCKITYNSNYGEKSDYAFSQHVKKGSNITVGGAGGQLVGAKAPTRSGYTFTGWKIDNTGELIANNTSLSTANKSKIVLYAQWEPQS